MSNPIGRPWASATACSLVFMSPLGRPIWRPRPLFHPKARRRAMCLEICRVDHDRLVLGTLGGQAEHDPGKDAVFAPPLPTVVEGLGRTVFLRRVKPPQPIEIY